MGLAITSSIFLDEYATYAHQVQPSSLPGAKVAAFLSTIHPELLLAIFVLLLFPDGRLPSHRWRWVAWLLVAGIALYVIQGILEHKSIPL